MKIFVHSSQTWKARNTTKPHERQIQTKPRVVAQKERSDRLSKGMGSRGEITSPNFWGSATDPPTRYRKKFR